MSTTLPSGPDADDDRRDSAFRGADRAPDRAAPGDPDPLLPDAGEPRRVEISGTCADEAVQLAEEFYGEARLAVRPAGDPFSFRFMSVEDARVGLRLATMTAPLEGDVARLAAYTVTWFRAAGTRVATRRAAVSLDAGQHVALPSSEPFRVEAVPGQQSAVRIARSVLERVATELHGGPIQPVAFRLGDAPSADALTGWRGVVSAAIPVIRATDASPLVRMESHLALARTMLATFAWDTRRVPPALLAPRLSRIRDAVEYLHDNAHLPITPADAAAVVGIHTRSLQNAFQRHLSTSPTEYLRGIRLDRVRRDLVEHTPRTATVSDLARAWGFGNLGRFASGYQARFGERPSDTLRRPAVG